MLAECQKQSDMARQRAAAGVDELQRLMSLHTSKSSSSRDDHLIMIDLHKDLHPGGQLLDSNHLLEYSGASLLALSGSSRGV